MVSLCLFVIILFLFGCFVSLWGWFAFSFCLFGLFMVDLCLFAVICDYFLSIFSLFKVIWLTSQEKFLQTNTLAPGELWPLALRDCALKACSPIYPCIRYIFCCLSMLFFSLFTFCLPQLLPEIPTPGDFFFVRGRFFTLLFPAILLLLLFYYYYTVMLKSFPYNWKFPEMTTVNWLIQLDQVSCRPYQNNIQCK